MNEPSWYEIRYYKIDEDGNEVEIPALTLESTDSDYGILEAEEIE